LFDGGNSKNKRSSLDITAIHANTFAKMPWYCTSDITNKEIFESNSTMAPV
jgi:hypothetical protein